MLAAAAAKAMVVSEKSIFEWFLCEVCRGDDVVGTKAIQKANVTFQVSVGGGDADM